jgi:hypothetical protein
MREVACRERWVRSKLAIERPLPRPRGSCDPGGKRSNNKTARASIPAAAVWAQVVEFIGRNGDEDVQSVAVAVRGS